MFVKDMDNKDFIDLCAARQKMGTEKYGDSDRFRDCAIDLVEEISDVVNISNLRRKRLYDYDCPDSIRDKINEQIDIVQKGILNLFYDVKELDKQMKRSEYPESDDVKRVWFDK